MGAAPSKPTPEQEHELRENLAALAERAAAAVALADVLIFTSGAGWSADSGLAVYRDVADVPAYREADLTYHDLCKPGLLASQPELFNGFWGGCFNDYRDTAPHEGYRIVARWRDEKNRGEAAAALRQASGAGAFFSFTSNVDAHWTRFIGAEELRECHGNSEFWQCTDRECARLLQAESAGGRPWDSATPDPRCGGGRWRAPDGFRFAVDEGTRLARLEASPAAPAAAAVGSRQSEDGGAFASNAPRCVRCGGIARPSILMFDDSSWMDNRAQSDGWASWQKAVSDLAEERRGAGEPLRVVVVEAGAGGNVTTVRNLSERLVRELGEGALLVRINPELPLADDAELQPRTLSLMARGLEAVRLIDAQLARLTARGTSLLDPADAEPPRLPSLEPKPGPEPAERDGEAAVVQAQRSRGEDESASRVAEGEAGAAAASGAAGKTDVDEVLTRSNEVLASLQGTWAMFERFDKAGKNLQAAMASAATRLHVADAAAAAISD